MAKVVVGICGRKRAGKDTVGKLIRLVAESNGLTTARLALADELKDELALAMSCNNPPMTRNEARLLLDSDEHKEPLRPMMQAWGEYRRKSFGEDYWIRKIEPKIDGSPYDIITVTDVRHPNEAEYINCLGRGVVVRVNNPIADRVTDCHYSEHALDGWFIKGSRTFGNGMEIWHLFKQVIDFCECEFGFGWGDITT